MKNAYIRQSGNGRSWHYVNLIVIVDKSLVAFCMAEVPDAFMVHRISLTAAVLDLSHDRFDRQVVTAECDESRDSFTPVLR